MQRAPLTFRLYQSVKFNRPVDKDDIVSPGGYEIKVKDEDGNIKSISFDFENYEGNIDADDPTIVHCMQKNPDYDCFEDLNILNESMLRNIVSIEEWFIYTGEVDDVKDDETPLIPIGIQDPVFEIIPQKGNPIQIPVTVKIEPESYFVPPICVCDNCGTPVMNQGDWGFNENEKEPTCLECGAILNLPEGY